uniref:Copper transport protein n=1 Tax=Globodera rostochiensis TaxID=31243 RepID=A0A914GTL8_GLORO
MPKMDMTFHFRINEFILFREWLPQSLIAYLFSLLAVLVLSIAEKRESQEQCCLVESVSSPSAIVGAVSSSSSSSGAVCNCLSPEFFYNVPLWPFSSQLIAGYHLLQSLLHFVQFFLGLSLMLVAMTYNVPIFITLLVGHSVGYFLTAPLYRHGLAEENRTGGECCCS